MAEKSKVRWKKWVVALAILVAITIAVIAIIFAIPKDTNKAKVAVASHNETAFLKDEDEDELFTSFRDKIRSNAKVYEAQAQNARALAIIIQNMMTFYDSYFYLASNNKTFQSQYNALMQSFKKADRAQSQIRNLLVQVEEEIKDKNAADYTSWAWGQFKIHFVDYMAGYADAFKSLTEIFHDCIAQGIINNDLTYLVLQVANQYFETILNEETIGTYMVSNFESFVGHYLIFPKGSINTSSPIYKYCYTPRLQDSVAKINKFTSIYEGKTFKDVIKDPNSFNKSYADTENVAWEVRNLVKGDLS